MNAFDSLKFGHAFLSVVRDPRKTEKIFDLTEIGFKPRNAASVQPTVDAAMADARFRQMYEEKWVPELANLDELDKLPDGTLGREFSRHMRTNGLSVDFFPFVVPDSPIKYVSLRLRQTHDIWHVLTGYGTDVVGEIALQAFYMAQISSGLSASLIAAGLLHQLRNVPASLPGMMDALTGAYLRGKQAEFLGGFRFEEMWELPLAEVREMAGLTRTGA